MRPHHNQVVDDEKSIILRWQKGDKRAFELLVKKYMRRSYFIALGLVGQHDDALDLSQETFIKVHRHRKKFDPNRRFFPWFYQVLKNLCFTWLKEQKSNPHTTIEKLGEQDEEGRLSDHFDPDLIEERDDIKDTVWKAISALKPHEREIIVLRHFQDLSYREISEVMSCSQGTVMSRLYYARKALRKQLEQMGVDE